MNKHKFAKIKCHNFYENNDVMNEYKALIKETTNFWYENKHTSVTKTEINLINSIKASTCPYCGSNHFKKNGHRKDGVQTYYCNDCHKRFNPLTNTIFDNKKIPISERMEYLINILGFSAISKAAYNNQNTITTGFYWLEKLFLVLEGCQDDIVLEGDVQIDEMFLSNCQKRRNKLEKKFRGISRNKICIACGLSANGIFILDANCSKLTKQACMNTYLNHIKDGSTILSDEEKAHSILFDKLNVMTCIFNSKVLKSENDKDNPLYRINELHYLIRVFFNRHLSFNKGKIQDRLNLCWFVLTPTMSVASKLEYFIKRAISTPAKLRFRTFYGKNTDEIDT